MPKESLIERIKASARITDVAAQYAEVKRSGPERSVCRCLCGQNSDRHPSFMLYENDDHFHCFACGRHGSVIDLVMLAERCDLKTAIDLLQRRYVAGDASESPRRVVRSAPAPETVVVTSAEARVVLNAAVAHYWRVLRDRAGASAWAYLTASGPNGRCLSETTLERLRVGYSDGLTLARALHALGVNLGVAAQAGLLSQQGEMMRGRIVFPVLDGDDAVFLLGRALDRRHEPKYLGLPDGLAHKQPMVCGQPERGVIVVEGPVDYAALVQWGLDAEFGLMALLGTGHAKAIPRLAELAARQRVLIALDQDKAGQDAALRLMSALTERGLRARVSVLTWREAKDCGELLQQGHRGRNLFERALVKAGA
jgi:DNA primase